MVATTAIKGMIEIHDIQKPEKKILRNIYGAVHIEGMWIKRPTKLINENTVTIKGMSGKWRLKFYWHLNGMTYDNVTKHILNIITPSEGKTNWVERNPGESETIWTR